MKKSTVLLVSSLVVGAVFAETWEKPAPIPREKGLYRCQIHRGGGKKARPDNSLETFLWCWGHGCTPEADARLTKDGVAIAMHDATLKRIGSGISPELAKKKISELTWDEVRDVDTGSYLGPEYATTRLATMESVFAAMKGRPERLLYLDEKGAPPEMMAEMSARFGVQEQVYYCSPNWQLIPRWRKMAPKGRSMVWLGAWPKNNSPAEIARTEKFLTQKLNEVEAAGWPGIDQIQIHVRTDLTKEDPFCPSTPFMKAAIERCHKAGVGVQTVTWTEGENKDVYRRLWALGFDHFTTDYPDTLFALLPEFAAGK